MHTFKISLAVKGGFQKIQNIDKTSPQNSRLMSNEQVIFQYALLNLNYGKTNFTPLSLPENV